MSELNYIDTGFGSKLINFTQAPFDNIDNQNTVEFGFGNKDFVDDAGIGTGDFKNTKSYNFGSEEVTLSKKEVKYEYEDIFERGSINISKNSFGEILIKNRLISNPILSCTTSISGLAADITINIERISTRKFRVFNPSNRNIQVNYIASFDNVKKTSISHNQLELDIKNKKTKEYAENYIISSAPKYATTDSRKIDLDNTDSSADPEYTDSGNIELDIAHELVINNITGVSSVAGTYVLPTLNANPAELNYFSLSMPTLEEVIQETGALESNILNEQGQLLGIIKIKGTSSQTLYNVEDVDNEENSTVALDSTGIPFIYNLHLQLSNNYYFWYSPSFVGTHNPESPGAWLYSTIRFPISITYT